MMTDQGSGADRDEPDGITLDDLPQIMHALFEQCVADARTRVDPQQDFDAFIDELWKQVAAAFSLVRRDWPADGPRPWPVQVEEQRGLAQALLEGRIGPDQLPG